MTARLAADLSLRAGREVAVPRLVYAPVAARRAALRERWDAGLPWSVDARYRLLLFHLRLLDPAGNPREGAGTAACSPLPTPWTERVS